MWTLHQLLSLKALIDRTKKKRKKSEPSVVTKKRKMRNARRREAEQRFGVQRRGEKEVEAFEEGVGEKAEMYNRMISGSPKNESTESSISLTLRGRKRRNRTLTQPPERKS